MLRITFLIVALALASLARAEGGPVLDDRYLAGYAAAVLEREFRVTTGTLRVRDGVVTIGTADLAGSDREKVVAALSALPGVRRVEIVAAEEVEPTGVLAEVAARQGVFLPRGHLFEPLLADPRWPHFSATYQRYLDDDELKNVGAPSFGITFGLYQNEAPFDVRWQLGLQAGVFAVFDLDAESSDLINADYLVALPVSARRGPFSVMFRILHQSSHLGDEFLLRNRIDRVNLSYEGLDAKLSWDVNDAVRVYGGGGVLLRREPSGIDPLSTQAGLELESPWSLFGGAIRPIAGVDVQNREEAGWRADVSTRAGFQLENREILSHEIQILVEYFDGRSPNGQFYEREIEYLGLGFHLQFGR